MVFVGPISETSAVRLSALFLASLALMDGTARAQPAAPMSVSHRQASPEQARVWAQLKERAEEAYRTGDYGPGVEHAVQALALAQTAFGSDHTNTLVSLNVLALMYNGMGRYAEAEPLFLRAFEITERRFGGEHVNTLVIVNHLAQLYEAQGRFAEAEPLFLRALNALESAGGEQPLMPIVTTNLAHFYDIQGRYAEAEPLYLRVLEAFERTRGRDDATTLAVVGNLAHLYEIQGRYAEAEPLFLRALSGSERTAGVADRRTLFAARNLAGFYTGQGRFADAEPLGVRALAGLESVLGRDHPATLAAVMTMAQLYKDQERLAEAEALYLRALEGRERRLGRDHPDTIAVVHGLAIMYSSYGRYAEADPLYLRALDAFQRTFGSGHPFTLDAARNLIAARLDARSTSSAMEPARMLVSALRSRRAAAGLGAFAQAQRGREQTQRADYFALFANAAWSEVETNGGDRTALASQAFTALQDATAGTTHRAVIQMAVRRVADDTGPGLGDLVRERESLNVQWDENSVSYSGALGADDANGENLRRSLPVERARIEARMDVIDTTLRDRFPQYFSLVRPEALTVAEAQAMLAPDEAILMVVPTPLGTHVMAISRTDLEWTRSSWDESLVNRAVQLLHWYVGGPVPDTEELAPGSEEGVVAETVRAGNADFSREMAFAVYLEMVAPAARVLEGKRHVFIAALGSLASLPFGMLVTEQPQGLDSDPAALRATSWFAEAHALIQIPSIQSLQFLRRFPHPAGPAQGVAASFVGFGNPAGLGAPAARDRRHSRARIDTASLFGRGRSRSGGAIVEGRELRLLSSLPGTATELENMRSSLGAPADALYLLDRATERNVRSADLSGVRILAFATHGLAGGEVWETAEPGLVFTPPESPSDADDGFLAASEVLTLRLDADWVILSACNTAAGDGSTGAPGLSGLARAFFYAGARNLLASHWPVDDDVAAKLTVRTIQILAEHTELSRAQAFQRAMREIRDDPSHDAGGTWAHPGAWAPFSLIGDGAH